MARLKEDEPTLHDGATVVGSRLGRFVEIGRNASVLHSEIGDYSYCVSDVQIANATVGKFCNIAAMARIGPTDHPMERAALHHFMYRSSDLWDDAEDDAEFFAARAKRRVTIGHDVWIGHGAIIRPEISIGHGAVVGAMAVVTKDVPDYTIVVGNPARVMRRRHTEETAARLIELAWWDWSHQQLRDALDDFRALDAEGFLAKYV